jgi:hypothetical protein
MAEKQQPVRQLRHWRSAAALAVVSLGDSNMIEATLVGITLGNWRDWSLHQWTCN